MSGSSSQAMLRSDVEETDPTGQYERYRYIISHPNSKKIVYGGIDQATGIQINWCKIALGLATEEDIKKNINFKDFCDEPKLLQSLHHENIIKCYRFWPDDTLKTVHMITEPFYSENLRDYSLKHGLVGNKQVIRRWCKQILLALEYLHSQNPPIMHRDLSLENFFIDGNTGEVKLGEFGVAIRLEENADKPPYAGTPEYKAPEYNIPKGYSLNYSETADIYSLGMCVLQMTCREKIYSECRNRAEIQSCIKRGVMPAALEQVTDDEIKHFIKRCLPKSYERPSASALLEDPFIPSDEEFRGIRIGESSRVIPDADADENADERQDGRTQGGGSKPVWRKKLSKLSLIMRKNK